VFVRRSKTLRPGASLSNPETAVKDFSLVKRKRPEPNRRPIPVIFGCAEKSLTSAEYNFFADANPFGFILFTRNCEHFDQVRRLVNELRQSVGREDAPILIDQEGGRVSRLQPPAWHKYPPMRFFGAMYEKDPDVGAAAIEVYARLVANELLRMGITVNCAPVVDLFVEGASNAIGDRAFSRKPMVVAELARRLAETFLDNGVMPVVKHIPGHGRLNVDPHHVSPVIAASRMELEADDFVPFELLKDLPIVMNSHAIFTALDPDAPASLSSKIHSDIIRGAIGFGGLVFSDDIAMKALYGPAADRAKGVLAAGADIALHCNGKLEEMEEIAKALQPMNDESWGRWEYAKTMVKARDASYNPAADVEKLDVLLGGLAYQAQSVG